MGPAYALPAGQSALARYPFGSEAVSRLVGRFAMEGDVEADFFRLRLDAQAKDELDELDDDQGADRGESGHRCDGHQLNPDLADIALDGARHAADGGHRQHAGGDGAKHAAHTVDGEDIERV